MCYGHLYKEFADLKLILSRKTWNRAGLNPIKTDYANAKILSIGSWSVKEEQKKMNSTWVLINCIIYLLFIYMSPDTPIPILSLKTIPVETNLSPLKSFRFIKSKNFIFREDCYDHPLFGNQVLSLLDKLVSFLT